MRPNQISLETAKILSEKLKMPIEHIMHTPPHIIMAKVKQLEEKVEKEAAEKEQE
ncbi:YycC-like protein [Evansella caseinilytica]|uniref:YycC-like protein n=1 Tax=Evansella caseinilytica TaxID=1503961 RepID=A0A1H3UXD6_9BACI|nr:YycC family protein [Evansella caseinilytica]SDZ67102.1 YycC-like protein [Evansella caseinilytica]